MLRGNGSARAETGVKATARPTTIRITMRLGPLRDAPDDDLSTITVPPFVTSIALVSQRWFSFGPGCAAEQAILAEASLFEDTKCQTLTTSNRHKTKIAIHPPGISF